MSLTLTGVAKRYGRRRGDWVVRGVDLTLAAGSMTVVSGANGSGKSTLLRIVSGLTRPSSGTVSGRPGRVAVVPDRFVPPPGLTAAAYLHHHARVRGLGAGPARRRADELASRFGLVPGLDTALSELSKGNAQKIGLAQAFLAPVGLLVLDEPRTAIDGSAAAVLDELLAAARADGTTVVLSDPLAGPPPPGTDHYRLTGGRGRAVALEPLAAGPDADDRVCVVLRSTRPGCPLDAVLAVGELAATGPDDATVTVAVDAARCDDLLRAALAAGWSVRSVQPSAAGPRRAVG